jgi:membrane-associated phospholipid phosphatase
MATRSRVPWCAALLGVGLLLRSASAGLCDAHSFARAASDSLAPLLVLGEVALYTDGPPGRQEAEQTAKGLIATALATELLKDTVREQRPNNGPRTSFPSGHASAAFAMATAIADYQPKYQWEAYGVATIIGWSRVELRAHHTDDVVAGALLGHYLTHLFTGKRLTTTGNGLAYTVHF